MIFFNSHLTTFWAFSVWVGKVPSILRRCRKIPACIYILAFVRYCFWHTDCTFHILSYLCWRSWGHKPKSSILSQSPIPPSLPKDFSYFSLNTNYSTEFCSNTLDFHGLQDNLSSVSRVCVCVCMFCSAGDWTHNLPDARQALYLWAISTALHFALVFPSLKSPAHG
jgi:hypothetical protein